jgi:hypothetical protein
MRRLALVTLLGAVLSSCFTPRDGGVVAPTAPAAGASAQVSPAPSVEPSPAPFASPSASPSSASTLENPPVTVSAEPFPIVTAFALTAAPVDEQVTHAVQFSIERYLEQLNRFRDAAPAEKNLGMIPVGGRFREAVAAGMAASSTPGVKRMFVIGSFRVDRLLVKPWGTFAVAEVTATILDKAVDGTAPDQSETGRLRLVGDRLWVADGWDDANARWFNGVGQVSRDSVRASVEEAVSHSLRAESWIPGMAPETFYGPGGETPYQKSRYEYLSSLDRTASVARTFADLEATIDRYETFGDINDGLAHVRVAGSVMTTDATGRTQREPFERRVVILFGNWMPEIVDEEISAGVWRSGGDLALNIRDHTFA